MGTGASKSPRDVSWQVLNRCSEDAKKKLNDMTKRMQRMRDDYIMHKKLPFDTRENPEVDSLRTALTQRIFLGNFGGAGAFYLAARSLTRYEPRFRRTAMRLVATFIGGSIGLWWAVSKGLPPFALGYLEKSNWAPRLLCGPINAFKPCIEDYGCRSIIEGEQKAGRTFIECYRICQRRADLWQQQQQEGEGNDDDSGTQGPKSSPPTEMFDERAAFEPPVMAEEQNGEGTGDAWGAGSAGDRAGKGGGGWGWRGRQG